MENELCLPQITDPETTEGVYSCSQGMFSCGEEPEYTDQITIGDYQSEEKFELKDDEEYIFVRLYRNKYLNNLEPVNILGNFIDILNHSDLKNSIIYNHASISTMLTDDFKGLALDNTDCDLKVEKCSKASTSLLKKCNINSSQFAVYGIKVSKGERLIIEKFLKDCLKDKKVTYNVMKFPMLAINNCIAKVKKTLQQTKFLKSSEAVNDIDQSADNIKDTFVCSTFVAYVLWKFTSVGKVMDAKKINYGNCMPNDIVSLIPGFNELFSGTFIEYDTKMVDFISKYPQFKKYIKGETD